MILLLNKIDTHCFERKLTISFYVYRITFYGINKFSSRNPLNFAKCSPFVHHFCTFLYPTNCVPMRLRFCGMQTSHGYHPRETINVPDRHKSVPRNEETLQPGIVKIQDRNYFATASNVAKKRRGIISGRIFFLENVHSVGTLSGR